MTALRPQSLRPATYQNRGQTPTAFQAYEDVRDAGALRLATKFGILWRNLRATPKICLRQSPVFVKQSISSMLDQSSNAASIWSGWQGCCGKNVFRQCGYWTEPCGPRSPLRSPGFPSVLGLAWGDNRYSSPILESIRATSMITRSIGCGR